MNYGAKNYIVARVDASFGDGWFYEGAGIYRHVWLTKTDALHLGKWESTVRTAVDGGGATLTPFGRLLVRHYRDIETEAAAAVSRHLTALDEAVKPSRARRTAP